MPYRIFLVEDHTIMRAALSALIGCEADLVLCGVAASAEEALEIGSWSDCDLLLTDVSLPGMDGLTLTERVHADHPDLPVVVVSADVEPGTVRRAEAAGVSAYLSKAGLRVTLASTLRDVLSGEEAPDAARGDDR